MNQFEDCKDHLHLALSDYEHMKNLYTSTSIVILEPIYMFNCLGSGL